jgi:SAM-dependent methyltransferase
LKTINNTAFYKSAIKEYGVSAQGVHWNSKYTQYKRFEILSKLIKKDIKTSTIIDVGCGFADFYKYLDTNNQLPLKYIGIDCEQDMINISQKRFPNEEFHLKDVLKDTLMQADYYMCSGAMNILKKEEVFCFIKQCYLHSKKGFVFNFLKEDGFNNVSYYQIIEFVVGITVNIKIKDTYLNNDFTILMLK